MNNVYGEQKSVQLSHEDACSARESDTLDFISVTNFSTVCVYAILVTVAVTQFVKNDI